ncbi:hypothetical protein [Fervidibacter sacchari]
MQVRCSPEKHSLIAIRHRAVDKKEAMKLASGIVRDGSYSFERPSPTRDDATSCRLFHLQIDHYRHRFNCRLR